MSPCPNTSDAIVCRPTSPVTADTIVGWVHRKYAAAGLTRRLTSADMAALEAAAGLPAARHGGGCVAAADDWLAFKCDKWQSCV